MTTPKDFLPASTFLEAPRTFHKILSGVGTLKHTEFLPVCKLLEAYIGGHLPPHEQGQMPGYLPSECNDPTDPLLACHNKRPFQRTVTLPECLTFNISTYSLSINNKIYL
jgi:hypothetical protein